MACLSPTWASLMTSFTPESPRSARPRRKDCQNAAYVRHRESDGPAEEAPDPLVERSRDTSLFEIPSRPSAFTSSSILRVLTPWM